MRIKLNRSGKALLSHQLAEWLKAAIRRGDYVDGDVLPGAVELAKAANVCERTALGALAILARAVFPIPYGMTSFTVAGVVTDTGLGGDQGWYALDVPAGQTIPLTLDELAATLFGQSEVRHLAAPIQSSGDGSPRS